MAIIHLFHGTSGNNAIKIMQEGFNGISKETVWDCSDIEKTYLYNMDSVCEAEGMKDEVEQYKIHYVMERANEGAQISASFESNPLNYTVVFEITVNTDTTNFMGFVKPDDSCPNMASCGAVQVSCDILNKFLKEGKIHGTLHFFPYFPKLSYFYIAHLLDNDYIQDKLYEMTELERTSLEMVSRLDICEIFEDLVYVEEMDMPKNFHF